VEASDILTQYWPPCGHGGIILTSQSESLRHRTTWDINLVSLRADEGCHLLLSYLPENRHTQDPSCVSIATAISQQVGGLPVLLVGLAGYISNSHMSLGEVLDIFKQSRNESRQILHDKSTSSTTFQYERPSQMVFNMALQALPAAARQVINIMAMLAADAIPESLLQCDIDEPKLAFLGFNDKFK
jgi:hypothetical protein